MGNSQQIRKLSVLDRNTFYRVSDIRDLINDLKSRVKNEPQNLSESTFDNIEKLLYEFNYTSPEYIDYILEFDYKNYRIVKNSDDTYEIPLERNINNFALIGQSICIGSIVEHINICEECFKSEKVNMILYSSINDLITIVLHVLGKPQIRQTGVLLKYEN